MLEPTIVVTIIMFIAIIIFDYVPVLLWWNLLFAVVKILSLWELGGATEFPEL